MQEVHLVLHQIVELLGIKQCTSTQILGICLEFWVGGAVAVGALKLKTLYNIKKQLEEIKTGKPKKKKKSKRRRNRKAKGKP